MDLREIREARAYAQSLTELSRGFDGPDKGLGDELYRAAHLIERMGRALSKSRTTVTAVRRALKEHAA